MKKFISYLLILISHNTLALTELPFEKIYFNRDEIEISGLEFFGKELLFVGDKLSNRAIYKIIFEKDRFYFKTHIDISALQNHNTYFASALLFKHGGRTLKSPFDLEGITSCHKKYYLVNEQARHILEISNQTLRRLDIDFEAAFKKFGYDLKKIPLNAGFEGIAADCENKVLYIAQERQPRAIIKYDLNLSQVTDIFDVEAKNFSAKVSPDFADIHFHNNHLYLLERNARQITKYNLKDKKVIERFSFKNLNGFHIDDLYNTGKPYGLAEGLAIYKNTIYIGIDNNRDPISKKAQKKFKVEGDYSSILVFKKPNNF